MVTEGPHSGDGGFVTVSYVDVLVPPTPNPQDLTERLRALSVRDGGQRIDPGPLDEATFHLSRMVLGATEAKFWLELPGGQHDLPVMLGLYLQILRGGRRMYGHFDGMGFAGPIVVIGLNTNLTERLRRIKVGSQSLSEALSAQRIRADGQVTDLRGTISPARAWGDGLLYLNTSLGWPSLPGVRLGAAIIDRGSFRNPETLQRAIAWAESHGARRLLVVAPLGVQDRLPDEGDGWVRWPWTPGLRQDILYELGNAARPCGPLSSNALLAAPPAPLGMAVYRAPALSATRRRCLAGVAVARRVQGDFPRAVTDCVRLINHLDQLWGSVGTANKWSVFDARAPSVATLARSVGQSRGDDFFGPWHQFGESYWPELRRNTLDLANLLGEYNPRLDLLLVLLDWAKANRAHSGIVVRTATPSLAQALRQDLLLARPSLTAYLSDADVESSPLRVLPYKQHLPWACRTSLQIHLGSPPPWRRSDFVSGEASEHLVAIESEDVAWMRSIASACNTQWAADLSDANERLSLCGVPERQWSEPLIILGPMGLDSRGDDVEPTVPYTKPALDLMSLFASFDEAIEAVGADDSDQPIEESGPSRQRMVTALPVTLSPDDAMYWLPIDARAEVLAGSRYTRVAASELTPGMTLLIPRGETREELYQRLQKAAYLDGDVMAVEMMLARFRAAVRDIHDRTQAWDEVAKLLQSRGSSVTSGQTCRAWATGDIIAPDDVQDIRRVGWLADSDYLLSDRAWARLGKVAEELRRLHRSLGRLLSRAIGEAASGQRGPAIIELSELCRGIDPAELLEEFDLRRIKSLGQPRSINARNTHRLLPADSRVGCSF
jgi:hypothetical protein